MNKPIRSVYLAGTMDVNDPEGLLEKFNGIQTQLEELGLEVYNPARGMGIREVDITLSGNKITPNEIVHRDLSDIDHSDMVVGFMDVPSIGTSCELMYAIHVAHIPVIIASWSPRVYDHPWIISLATKRLRTINQVLAYLKDWWL